MQIKALSEFKKFVLKNNVFDLAVAVIIGGAVGKIVTSLVNDILMPVIGLIIGGVNIRALNFTVKSPIPGTAPVVIGYGSFIQSVIDFTIISFCIFLLIKFIQRVSRKKEEEKVLHVPSETEKLLAEIRDLLKNKSGAQ